MAGLRDRLEKLPVGTKKRHEKRVKRIKGIIKEGQEDLSASKK